MIKGFNNFPSTRAINLRTSPGALFLVGPRPLRKFIPCRMAGAPGASKFTSKQLSLARRYRRSCNFTLGCPQVFLRRTWWSPWRDVGWDQGGIIYDYITGGAIFWGVWNRCLGVVRLNAISKPGLFPHRPHDCWCCRDSKLQSVDFNAGDILPATSLELDLGKWSEMHGKAMSARSSLKIFI